MQSQKSINQIVVVGGGTAGWLSASILAARLGKGQGDYQITLIESPDIATIGVGEGTVPSMRDTLRMIGISETDFIRECDATFKQSIHFVDWLYAPTEHGSHSYQHLFQYPLSPGVDLSPYWLLGDIPGNLSFENTVSFQGKACHSGLGPKRITHKEFEGQLDYAYHLDAGKFVTLLSKHGTSQLGIKHILANVQQVKLDKDGDIASVSTDTAGDISGDLFIDCTGFSSLLLSQTLGVDFIDKDDYLFVDYAVAMQVPYPEVDTPIPSYTIATAQENGWTWDIGLQHRRGVGYVYSSRHTSHERAEEILRTYVGPAAEQLTSRRIPMRIGYRERFWQRNCVAFGLSAGFLEPLEATAILLVEASAKLLAEQFPASHKAMPAAASKFNRITRYGWDRTIDFIKLHYYLSRRTDTAFWRDNTRPQSAPGSLLEKLEHWQHHLPSASDFFSKYEVFDLENYQYVLYGMEFDTKLDHARGCFPHTQHVQQACRQMQSMEKQLLNKLTPHRQLIEQIKQHGMQKL